MAEYRHSTNVSLDCGSKEKERRVVEGEGTGMREGKQEKGRAGNCGKREEEEKEQRKGRKRGEEEERRKRKGTRC